MTGYTGSTTYGYKGISITNGVGTITNKAENSTTPIGTTEEPLKARLPKISEVYNTGTDANHCHNSEESCPAWLTNELAQYSTYYPDNEHIGGIYGYWLLSSDPGSSGIARNVNYYGNGNYNTNTSYASSNGLRPVITVSTSDLS